MSRAPISSDVFLIESASLHSFVQSLFVAAGCEPADAGLIAETFVEADLQGVGPQGLDHVPTMLRLLLNRTIDPFARPQVVTDRAGLVLIDGRRGPGQIAANFAIDVGCDKARDSGACVVGIRNSAVLFMMGYYAERAARRGYLAVLFTDTPPLVHAQGGNRAILGTNPVAVGIPLGDRDPVLIDLATSAISFSRLRQASYSGSRIPEFAAIDDEGIATTDPQSALRGALSPLGGHKGSALGLAVAVLSGPLVGAAVGPALSGWIRDDGQPGSKGHLFIIIDPSAFGPAESFEDSTEGYLNEIRATAVEGGEVRIPGERRFEERKRRLAGGIPISRHVWDRIAPYAKELGVAMPSNSGAL
jgi:LDH2 family malate/lactate/ureidoglycolate dehydrogenase